MRVNNCWIYVHRISPFESETHIYEEHDGVEGVDHVTRMDIINESSQWFPHWFIRGTDIKKYPEVFDEADAIIKNK